MSKQLALTLILYQVTQQISNTEINWTLPLPLTANERSVAVTTARKPAEVEMVIVVQWPK